MFDISTVNKRYFSIKITVLDDNDEVKGIELEVEPPKVKMLKKLIAARRTANEDSMEELAETLRSMLSKNKSGYKVPVEFIDELDFDQMIQILTAYFEWLGSEKNSKN